MDPLTVFGTLGGTLAAIVSAWAAVRALRKKDAVPELAERNVSRGAYIDTVLRESTSRETNEILAMTKSLSSRGTSKEAQPLQDEWAKLKGRVSIRVLSEATSESLKAATELTHIGAAVRFLDQNDLDSFSFHLFRGAGVPRALINHRDPSNPTTERPLLLSSVALARLLEQHFKQAWSRSRDLESTLATRVLAEIEHRGDREKFSEVLDEICSAVGANASLAEVVRRRARILSQAKYIFFFGPPGAGKTTVRSILEKELASRGLGSISMSDYPILYELYLRDLLQISGAPNGVATAKRFNSQTMGGFEVVDSSVLSEAETQLAAICLREISSDRVVLIELARTKYSAFISGLDRQVVRRAKFIVVSATSKTRQDRLQSRVGSPRTWRESNRVGIVAPDDHFIDAILAERLYPGDDLENVRTDRYLKDRFVALDSDRLTLDGLRTWSKSFSDSLQEGQ